MDNAQVIRLVNRWVEKVGRKSAIRKMVIAGVSPVTAEKLACGRYHSTPRDLLTKALLEEMMKDGISLAKGKAS